MNILFMGTPEFAKVSLEYLVNDNFNVAGAITQPDKPKGRKMVLAPSPVKEYCLRKNIPVYQPQSSKSAEFFELLENIAPDVIAVVAYGQILPKNVLEYPRYGCVNAHASLLPKYRGANPIYAAIAEGETATGITTIYMDEGIDTGDMILRESIQIGENETYGELYGRLAQMGGEALAKTLAQIQDGSAKREEQPKTGASHTKKTDEQTREIDWSQEAKKIHDKIRALSPSPAAFTRLNGKKIMICKSEIISACENALDIGCKGGIVRILELQPEGGRKMSAKDFLNGRKIEKGAIWGE